MNRKAQLAYPIITFAFIVVALILVAPIMMKILNDTTSKFGDALVTSGIGGGVEANASMAYVQGTFNNFWDSLIMIALVVNIILLLLSAFLVDIHPVFFVLYFVFAFITILFVPTINAVTDTIYNNNTLYQNYTQTNALQYTSYLQSHLGIFLLAIIVISAIIMYGKLRFGRGGGGGY